MLPHLSKKLFLLISVILATFSLVSLSKAEFVHSTEPVEGISQAWVDQQGMDVLRYANYIKSLNLKHITPEMVLKPHFQTRGRTSNGLPPRYLWKNIAPTLKTVDEMCERMNSEILQFVSIYRSPQYNRAVRGKSRSYALQNCAVKVRFKDITPRTAAKVARELRSEGFFNGGIGTYDTFMHLDTRGSKADW